jgi:hypothetical protein
MGQFGANQPSQIGTYLSKEGSITRLDGSAQWWRERAARAGTQGALFGTSKRYVDRDRNGIDDPARYSQ